MILTEEQKTGIKAHSIEQYEAGEQECCGFILITGEIFRCRNNSATPTTNFVITEQEVSVAYRQGVQAIYHSHTTGLSNFSPSDGKGCRDTGKPWILYNVPTNDFKCIDPSGFAPYIGRDFCWWVNDCYEIVRDYYRNEFGIELDQFTRPDLSLTPQNRWQPDEWNVFEEAFSSQGFVKLTTEQPIKRGDIILFALHGGCTNHIGLMFDLEDGLFLHQLMDRPSSLDIWADAWRRFSVGILRHKRVR